MAYSSYGMHDTDILESTEWGRPYFNWKPGAISVIQESYGGSSLRTGLFAFWDDDNVETLNTPVLRVDAGIYLFGGVRHVVPLPSYRVGIFDKHDDSPLRWMRNGQLCDVETHVPAGGVAEIDLSDQTIEWPQQSEGFRVRVFFPTDDNGYHDNEPLLRYFDCVGSRDLHILMSQGQGLRLPLLLGRQKASEYIRGGCTGITAAVSEPGGGYVDGATTLARYAKGYSWAESAYMATNRLAYKALIIGDPLMSPFADYLSVITMQPAPNEGDTVKGIVPLAISVTPDLGSIVRVEVCVTDSATSTRRLIGTDTIAPYEARWNSPELSDGNPVYPDGGYTIEVVVYQDERAGGSARISRSVTLDNTSLPSVLITAPDAEYAIVSASTPVQAQPDCLPPKVEFWLLGQGSPILAGTATTAPYQCAIAPSVADNGAYELQAAAYYDSEHSISFSPPRKVVLANNALGITSVSPLSDALDGTDVFLVGVPVTSGTSPANDGGFYVQDYDRASGIMVQASKSVSRGREVAIGGVLHTVGGERYIEATYPIWDMGPAEIPRALVMATRSIGGISPEGITGVSSANGVYNTGLLVTACGRITCDDSGYAYVDDGCSLVDASGVYEPIQVPLDGAPIPQAPNQARGLRVYCPGLASAPGVGDYAIVTGVSSLYEVNEGSCPMLRVEDASGIVLRRQYPRAYGASTRLVWPDNSDVPVGAAVRLVNQCVEYTSASEVWVSETDPAHMYACTSMAATTALVVGDYITVLGDFAGQNQYGWAQVTPTAIYLTYRSQASGQSQSFELLALDDVYVTSPADSQRALWSEIDAVLSRPVGSTVELNGVMVVSVSDDGMTWGLKDIGEPLPEQPRLVLRLDQPIQRLTARSFEIDVHGATRTTLPDGRSAIISPSEILLYTDASGKPCPPVLIQRGVSDMSDDWPWKRRVAP